MIQIKQEKMKKYIILLAITISLLSCNDEFLERIPQDKLTEETAFQTSENFATYAWSLYRIFDDGSQILRVGSNSTNGGYSNERHTDNIAFNYNKNYSNKYAFHTITIPTTTGQYSYDYIRKVNIMLANIDNSKMSEADKNHWRGVGLFFRSYRYFDMMFRYGDIQWVETPVGTDDERLFMPRTPRDEVAANLLRDLKFAEENVKDGGNGRNTINKDVVRAFLSRFSLMEGTWRKYHQLGDADKYLSECKRVSDVLVNKYPNVMPKYYDLYTSESLVGETGIILAFEYETDQLTHHRARYEATSAHYYDLTKDAVDSYLCQDGQTIENTSVDPENYNPNDPNFSIYSEFRNRDHRLYFTVCPPYQIKKKGDRSELPWHPDYDPSNPTAKRNPQGNFSTWLYDDFKPEYREYIDLLEQISPDAKRIPMSNWNNFVVYRIPHFRTDPQGQGYNVSMTGYYTWKYYTKERGYDFAVGQTSDAPIFRIGEVMLNLAEATYELDGTLSQDVADRTINKLRARGNVTALNVNSFTPDNSSRRDASVSDLLWEIRRERRVEFMGDGLRYYDIRRWKKGDYMNKEIFGVNTKQLRELQLMTYQKGVTENAQGFVTTFGDPVAKGFGWEDFMYLEPMPSQELLLNEQLQQNAGWDSYSPN
ncbi:RagB/SusD family nutrient uptake outer membrane protein [Puteibacter caeruleilacunae]|nr:RagB/SusD family nutrient uptake outer membrane protein [Puteibacter caeruleilacunae]